MPNLVPVDQVAAVKNGQSREILKCGGDEIIIIPNPTNGGIRVKA